MAPARGGRGDTAGGGVGRRELPLRAMKISCLTEPELEFGTGRHVDIRFGLMNHGPLDVGSSSAPKRIRCGIVGTSETVEGLARWLERCRREIVGKETKKPNLFPRFPGFNDEAAFRSSLVLDPRLQRTIPQRVLDDLVKKEGHDEAVKAAVGIVRGEFEHLVQNATVDLLICAVPGVVADLMAPEAIGMARTEEQGGSHRQKRRLDFHHLLKATAMDLAKPVQLILPSTYDPTKRRRQMKRSETQRQLQDEATIAWNIFTAMYYKAGGAPWRLVREPTRLQSCFVGVAFYQALDSSSLRTSMAQVFDERGDGLIVRGAPVQLSKEDLQPHLSDEDASRLLKEALTQYRAEHKTLPARVVMYKTSSYIESELRGFRAAAAGERVDTIEFISTARSLSTPRLLRNGAYPPLRGTFLSLDERSQLLYTRGSVPFFATYPGMYVPWPFLFRCEDVEETPRNLAAEILALTKMNWNDTQFDGAEPITVEAARRVGQILKYVEEGARVAPRYSFYM
jgi:hypothetical protein